MKIHEFKTSIIFLTLSIVTVLLGGTIVFSLLEGWSLVDSLYFVTMTATTVGYGDLTPTHTLSKIVTIMYSLSIIPFVLYIFSLIARYETSHMYHKIHQLEYRQREHEEDIEKAERRMQEQKRKIKEQEEALGRQERKLKEQMRINKKQGVQIEEQEEELDVVEDIVEDTLAKGAKKKKK